MGFLYSVYLPGFNKTVWVEEINSKSYKDLVKSLYNNDESSFIVHSNNLIEQIVPRILQEGLNVVDKLILLVNARAVSVNPDLNIKAICKETRKDFETVVKLDTIFDKLTNIHYKNITKYKNITVEHSIVKAKDEIHFLEKTPELLYIYQIASSIDIIRTENDILKFNELDFTTRCNVAENLPVQLNAQIIQSLFDTETKISKNKLLVVDSPFSKIPAVDIPLSTDIGILLQFSRMLFTDDLNNIYKLIFNLVTKLGFEGEYVDKLAPAEMYLYWALFLQENQKSSTPPTPENVIKYQGEATDFKLDGP